MDLRGRRETTFELTSATVKALLSDFISLPNHTRNFLITN